MTLKDTIPLMLSDDWKDRLKAEYWQAKIRLDKLFTFIDDVREGRKESLPTGAMNELIMQAVHMQRYFNVLKRRVNSAKIEL